MKEFWRQSSLVRDVTMFPVRMRKKHRQVRPVPFDKPLNELARSKPSEVISRN
jgi:hypothetical protein